MDSPQSKKSKSEANFSSEPAKPKPFAPMPFGPEPAPWIDEIEKILVLSNLNKDRVTKEIVESICSIFGDVTNVYLKRTKAFVIMADEDSARDAAKNLNGWDLWDKVMIAYVTTLKLSIQPRDPAEEVDNERDEPEDENARIKRLPIGTFGRTDDKSEDAN